MIYQGGTIKGRIFIHFLFVDALYSLIFYRRELICTLLILGGNTDLHLSGI